MKLGIIVVYLIKEEDEKLLELHLSRIERHTGMPYTIYGCANRLLPKFIRLIEKHPRIRIFDCEHTNLRDSEEHAFYLEQLVKIAIRDGATHIVTLHIDSFPVRDGWADELAGKLSEFCVLSAIMRDEKYDRKPNTACMFFHRDFYLKYHPTFRLSGKETSFPAYKRYKKEYAHVPDSGVGYGFKIYLEGLAWHPLLRSDKDEDHCGIGSIYGDLIFHLSSANRELKCFPGDDARTVNVGNFRKAFVALRNFGAPLLPNKVREKAHMFLPRAIEDFLFPQYKTNEEAFITVKKDLLSDPESYLNYLRTGKR